MYAIEVTSCSMIYSYIIKFIEEWCRHSNSIKVMSQKFDSSMLVLLMGGIYDVWH
jgi:hypothetical protein